MEKNTILQLKNASKLFKDNNGIINKLFEGISFDLNEKEFLSIVSASGTGKSTLLKVIGGLENLSDGELEIDTDKKIIYIPSKPSSLPWLNVIENIKSVMPDSPVDINKIIKMVGLEGYEAHMPDNRSFGFRFRISLARALACEPSVILLDEPFNELSVESKKEIYLLVNKIYYETGISFILSTTNITEALFLSDKVFLFKGKPSKLSEAVDTQFGKERNLSLLKSPEFIGLRKKIEEILTEDGESGFSEFKF